MDEALKLKAEQLAGDIAAQAQTLDDFNGLIRTLMKSALERMLDTEIDVHLGRKTSPLPAPLTQKYLQAHLFLDGVYGGTVHPAQVEAVHTDAVP